MSNKQNWHQQNAGIHQEQSFSTHRETQPQAQFDADTVTPKFYDKKQKDVFASKKLTMTQKGVRLLGVLSILPFLLTALIAWLYPTVITNDQLIISMMRFSLYYGAACMTFLAGVRWGMTLIIEDTPEIHRPKLVKNQSKKFTSPVVIEDAIGQKIGAYAAIVFVGWMIVSPAVFGFVIPTELSFITLTVMFFLLGHFDQQAGKRGIIPGWYGKLRGDLTLYLTIIMVVILARIFTF